MIGQRDDTYIVPNEVVSRIPGGRYQLIITASRRAHDLQKGLKPLIKLEEYHKPTVIALMEVEAGLIPLTYPHGFVDPHDYDEEEENE